MATIVIGDEINSAFVELVEQQACKGRQTSLRIAHGRRIIAISGTKVTLTINEGVTQGKLLRHSDQGVIRCLVTVRVVFAQHITHYAGGLHGLGTRLQTHGLHRVKNPALNRLLPIADVRQRATANDRHRVIEVGLFSVQAKGQGCISIA